MWKIVSRSTQEGLLEYILKPGTNTLGRDKSNDIQIPDIVASRKHCEIYFEAETNSPILRDLGSKNGTFVHGKRVTTLALEAGDQIRIGKHVLVISNDAESISGDQKPNLQKRPVTSELVLQSVDHHAILLNQIAQRLNTASDLDSALEKVTTLTKRVLGADRCLVITAEHFDQLKKGDFPWSIARPAIEDRLIVQIRDAQKDSNLGETAMLEGVHSALCVPVLADGEVAAILYMDKTSASAGPFSELELELAVGISNQLALAIQRKNIEAKALHDSLHDSLTDLPNQVLFTEYLLQAVEKTKQKPNFSFAVITLDLDDFQIVNDTYGYAFGDQLLNAVTQRLRHFLRIGDELARVGGDEFALLYNDIKDEGGMLMAANELMQAFAQPFSLNDREIYLSVGAGIGMSSLGYDKSSDILRDAETAMFHAKEEGKAQFAIFDKNMRQNSIARMSLEAKLHKALEHQEFRVYYQPIISLQEGRTVGFEALAQWEVSPGHIIPAADFIPLAEGTQVIFDIDMFVSRTACTALSRWQKQFANETPLFVSANLSGRQIAHRELIKNIKEITEGAHISPNSLNLEFTETSLMEEKEATIVILNKIKDLGVRTSVDDFGTGYSSLTYLRFFPIDYIKIDRSFISRGDWDITNLIMEMARLHHFWVIAEGVETQEQLDHLRKLNCHFAQGYFFSKAMDAKSVESWLTQDPHW